METNKKIAIDCRPLQNAYASRAIGTIVRNLLVRLVKSRASTSLVLCGRSTIPPMRCGSYHRLMRPDKRVWYWEQLGWPVDLLKTGASIFHSSVSLGPLEDIGFPLLRPAKSIATVYDLVPQHYPEYAPRARRMSFRLQCFALKSADRIIVISQFVKKDLVDRLGISENRIKVLPLAVDQALALAFDGAGHCDEQQDGRFILTMGESGVKNITTALAAFEKLADRGYPGNLRVVGAFGNQVPGVQQRVAASSRKDRIVFLSDISLAQLVANYAMCDLFLFPSLMEGYGLPVIEAMYCGAPVVCANSSSLPEAGGSAAVYCDPLDADAFVQSAERLLADDVYRKDIVEKGKKLSRQKSWDETAEMVIGIYEELGWRKYR